MGEARVSGFPAFPQKETERMGHEHLWSGNAENRAAVFCTGMAAD